MPAEDAYAMAAPSPRIYISQVHLFAWDALAMQALG